MTTRVANARRLFPPSNFRQTKAAFRNPDEFYHKMLSTKTKGGVHAGKRRKGAGSSATAGDDVSARRNTFSRSIFTHWGLSVGGHRPAQGTLSSLDQASAPV